MTDATEALADAEAKAKAVTTPETFNFAEAVLDRSYPETKVPVYLNEKSVQSLIDVLREREALELRLKSGKGKNVANANKLSELDEKHDELVKSLRSEEYVVLIRGIAPEEHIKIEAEAYEVYPREYEESTHALTNATIKIEKPNDERDIYIANRVRQAHIVSVTAPNGAVDADFSDIEKVKATFARLPFLARAKVDQAINQSTIDVDFYREIVDEVF